MKVTKEAVVAQLRKLCVKRKQDGCIGMSSKPWPKSLDEALIYAHRKGYDVIEAGDIVYVHVYEKDGVLVASTRYSRRFKTVSMYSKLAADRENESVIQRGYYTYRGCLKDLAAVYGESDNLSAIVYEIYLEDNSYAK